jgi:hypothetical protein
MFFGFGSRAPVSHFFDTAFLSRRQARGFFGGKTFRARWRRPFLASPADYRCARRRGIRRPSDFRISVSRVVALPPGRACPALPRVRYTPARGGHVVTDTPTECGVERIWAGLRRRKVVQWRLADVTAAWRFLQSLE